MTHYIASRGRSTGLLDRLASLAHDIRERRERHAIYRRTVDELNALTDRDLADLGVHRSEVPQIAREAAFGS